MNPDNDNLLVRPATDVKPVVLAIQFAADFPVEFQIQRLVDVPLRPEPQETRLFPAAECLPVTTPQ